MQIDKIQNIDKLNPVKESNKLAGNNLQDDSFENFLSNALEKVNSIDVQQAKVYFHEKAGVPTTQAGLEEAYDVLSKLMKITKAKKPEIAQVDGVETRNLLLPNFRPEALNEKSPFQVILNKVVESLNEVSSVETKNNDLIKDYVDGKASIEEVMISTNKLTLAMSLATTVINTAVQTFKEIQQIPV